MRHPLSHFKINIGTRSSIRFIWVFSPHPLLLNLQLNHASAHFLLHHIRLDPHLTTITLPKICKMYANDFGGNKQLILQTIMQFMPSLMGNEGLSLLFCDILLPGG